MFFHPILKTLVIAATLEGWHQQPIFFILDLKRKREKIGGVGGCKDIQTDKQREILILYSKDKQTNIYLIKWWL